MKAIYKKDREPYLKRLQSEPHFQCGHTCTAACREGWWTQEVILEVPLGELAEDALKTMALKGRRDVEVLPLDGTERFNAQGLEGKVRIRKDFSMALMNLDLCPQWRGRILLPAGTEANMFKSAEAVEFEREMKVWEGIREIAAGLAQWADRVMRSFESWPPTAGRHGVSVLLAQSPIGQGVYHHKFSYRFLGESLSA